MTWFKGFFRPGENPGQFGENTNGPGNQTNNECCNANGNDQLMTCADLLNCQIIQELINLSHSPVTLAPSATLGGMSIGPTQVLGMTQATTLTNGWLSSADWNTFNSKMTSFDITDSSTTQTVSNLQAITFVDSFPILAVVSAPRTITFSLDATGAAPGDVLTYVGPGFAWMAAGGGLTGGGTVDFVPRWSPIGTNLVDSVIQSTATRASIGTAPVATAMFSIVNVGLATGLDVLSVNTTDAARFRSTGTSTNVVEINQSAVVASAVGASVFNTSAVAGGTNIGYYSTVSGANAGGTNIGGDFHASGATTNYGVRSEGNIVPFVTKTYTLGTAALRFSGLFLGCNIDYNNDLLFDFVGATQMTLTTTGRLGINVLAPTELLQVGGNIAPDATIGLRELGVSTSTWSRLWMGTTGRAYFGDNFITKSSSANGLEINVSSGIATWTFGWNNGQLRAVGTLDVCAVSLESASADTCINHANTLGTRQWNTGKFGDNYKIKGIIGGGVMPDDVFFIEQTTSNAAFGTVTPHASALFEVFSITKGFLPPRMTNAQRVAIVAPAIGLIVYCTDIIEGLYINKSTGWTFVI